MPAAIVTPVFSAPLARHLRAAASVSLSRRFSQRCRANRLWLHRVRARFIRPAARGCRAVPRLCVRSASPKPEASPATPHRRAVSNMRLARPVSLQNGPVFRLRVEPPLRHRRSLSPIRSRPYTAVVATASDEVMRSVIAGHAYTDTSPANTDRDQPRWTASALASVH